MLYIIFIGILVSMVSLNVLILVNDTKQIHAATLQSVPCPEIQKAYSNVLYRIWIDNPNYVEDVLNETDEWCNLYDLVGESWMSYDFKSSDDSIRYHSNLNQFWVPIPDSTYHRLRKVFSDLPAQQATPDEVKPVEQIEMPHE